MAAKTAPTEVSTKQTSGVSGTDRPPPVTQRSNGHGRPFPAVLSSPTVQQGMGPSLKPSVAVVGAGPYGLSVAAHLRASGVRTEVFGSPFSFWRAMPAGMALKSPWSASSLSDPKGSFTLDAYVRDHRVPHQEPVPIGLFLKYGEWFRERAVGAVDTTPVACVKQGRHGFVLQLEDGSEVTASRVVMATGIQGFPNIPDFAQGLPRNLVLHTGDHLRFDLYSGMRVGVVGAGQSALETAIFLHEAGAQVEVITRGPIRWADRRLYERGGITRKVFYPPADVGPVGLNWLVAAPSLFRLIPSRQRTALGRRAIRPSGAKWLRPRFAPEIRTTTYAKVERMSSSGKALEVLTSDGVSRRLDRVVLGTGYRPDIGRVQILDDQLRLHIRQSGGYPLLDRRFQSSVSGLHFVGAMAGYTFGPLCRFVAGAGVAARAVARAA
jgi:FAD-dependent urate hydroxylase